VHGITNTAQLATLDTTQTITALKTINLGAETLTGIDVIGRAKFRRNIELRDTLSVEAQMDVYSDGFIGWRARKNTGNHLRFVYEMDTSERFTLYCYDGISGGAVSQWRAAHNADFIIYPSLNLNSGALKLATNTVINSDRHFVLRQYPTGSLPSAVGRRGQLVYDSTTEKALCSNNTTWNNLY
jgi:hypothetical protein